MKKQVLMIAAALLLGTMSFAQGAGPKGGAPGAGGQGKGGMQMRGQGRMGVEKKVIDQLGLNATQKTKVAALEKAEQEKMKAAFAGMKPPAQGEKPDRTKMQAAMKKMRDEHQAGLKAILTAAQYSKYETLMKAEMEKFRKDHPGGPGGAGAGAGKGGKKPPL